MMIRIRSAWILLIAIAGVVILAVVPGCDDDDSHAPLAAPSTASAPAAQRGVRDVPLSPELQRIVGMIARGQFDEAQSALDSWQAEHPDDARGTFVAGLILHKQRRYADAEPLFANAIERSGDMLVMHHYHGWCLYYLGEMNRARGAFEKHLASDPDAHDSHFALGLIDLESGALEQAEDRFRRVIKLIECINEANPARAGARAPDLAKNYARLGEVQMADDRMTEARESLERSIAIYPLHTPAYYALSTVCRRLGDEQAADDALRQFELIRSRIEQSRSVVEE